MLIALCAILCPKAFPQARIGGRAYASAYSGWNARLVAAAGPGVSVVTLDNCIYQVPGGSDIFPISTSTPLTINDSNSETATPSAVTKPLITTGAANGYTCSATLSLSNSHPAGSYVTFGDGGVGAAVKDLKSGIVVLDPSWYSTVAITSLPGGNANVSLSDERVGPEVKYCWGGSAYAVCATGSGSGTVASGTQGQPASYSANGTSVRSTPLYRDATPFATVQSAMTTAGNGVVQVPPTGGPSDIPNGTRMTNNYLNPTLSTQPSGAHLLDYRFGNTADFINNPGNDGVTALWNARQFVTNWNEPVPAQQKQLISLGLQTNVLSGTQNANYNGYLNKVDPSSLWTNLNIWSPAQSNGISFVTNHFSMGDAVNIGGAVVDFGAQSANTDEGPHALSINGTQGYIEYAGTLVSPTTGATTLTVSPSQGQGTQGDLRALIYRKNKNTFGSAKSATGRVFPAKSGGGQNEVCE